MELKPKLNLILKYFSKFGRKSIFVEAKNSSEAQLIRISFVKSINFPFNSQRFDCAIDAKRFHSRNFVFNILEHSRSVLDAFIVHFCLV